MNKSVVDENPWNVFKLKSIIYSLWEDCHSFSKIPFVYDFFRCLNQLSSCQASSMINNKWSNTVKYNTNSMWNWAVLNPLKIVFSWSSDLKRVNSNKDKFQIFLWNFQKFVFSIELQCFFKFAVKMDDYVVVLFCSFIWLCICLSFFFGVFYSLCVLGTHAVKSVIVIYLCVYLCCTCVWHCTIQLFLVLAKRQSKREREAVIWCATLITVLLQKRKKNPAKSIDSSDWQGNEMCHIILK